jgi:hypothetical protein
MRVYPRERGGASSSQSFPFAELPSSPQPGSTHDAGIVHLSQSTPSDQPVEIRGRAWPSHAIGRSCRRVHSTAGGI